MREREPRWARFTKAAVGDVGSEPAKRRRWRLRRHVEDLKRRLAAAHTEQAAAEPTHRADIRLLPAVVAAWATAAIAIAAPVSILLVWVIVLGGGMLVSTSVQWLVRNGSRGNGPKLSRGDRRPHSRTDRRPNGWRVPVAFVAASGPTVLLAGLCIFAVLLSAGLRIYTAANSPLDLAVSDGSDWVLTLEVGTTPRTLDSANGPPIVTFDAFVVRASAHQRVLTGRMTVRVMADTSWAQLKPGDRADTAGRIAPAQAREKVSGILHPTTGPQSQAAAKSWAQRSLAAIRKAWVSAVHGVWDTHSKDTAGLLPGMVMGDRGGMNSELNDAMKTVGLTHLTAVSGANCTLVLASLMLALRSMRTPQLLAIGVSGAGLLVFVLLVGPDPSVLRAAVMGAMGAMAILSGRPKRVGALLSASILVLILADPWLAVDYAFILSVLATLGLHLVGRRCVRWLSVLMPLWLAQAVAIPLSAQLFCAPVIVLLQARLTPYTIPANMLAAPVVALVTTVGTLGMVSAAILPPVGALCAAISGSGAWWVGWVARTMSALPAASLPWPEGPQGVIFMAVLNMAVLACLFSIVQTQRVAVLQTRLLGYIDHFVPKRFVFGVLVTLVAATTAWWTAAVLRL